MTARTRHVGAATALLSALTMAASCGGLPEDDIGLQGVSGDELQSTVRPARNPSGTGSVPAYAKRGSLR